MGELVLGIGDFNGHVGKQSEGYEDVHGGNGIGERNVEGKMLEFCDEKELCVANTWFRKWEKRKVTYSTGGNEWEIDFVLVGKGNRKYLRDAKVIPGELQHRLVVVDLVKKKVNAGGGCEAAVTARARIGWVKFRECGELLNSKRFPLKLKGMVYRSCDRRCYMGVRHGV